MTTVAKLKLLKKVKSLGELSTLAKQDPRYLELAVCAAENLGGTVSSNPEKRLSSAMKSLYDNMDGLVDCDDEEVADPEASIVDEVNFCRDLVQPVETLTIGIDGPAQELPRPLSTNDMRPLFNVGDRVRVVDATDEACDLRFMEMSGIVVRRQYSTALVGESRHDPFYTVRFGKIRKEDGFWHEELVLVRKVKV